jgi:hypothetical protein
VERLRQPAPLVVRREPAEAGHPLVDVRGDESEGRVVLKLQHRPERPVGERLDLRRGCREIGVDG